jgi:hypothetical protein
MLQKISKVNALTLLFKVEFGGERACLQLPCCRRFLRNTPSPLITKLEILKRVER